MRPLKVAIVAHGRYHAVDLARELLRRGHDVTMITNYPWWQAERLGVPRQRVRSFLVHGLLFRISGRVQQRTRIPIPEPVLYPMFGRWARRQVLRERWDVVYTSSGVSEEVLRDSRQCARLRVVWRGSSHIRTQARLLEEEGRRTGVPQERPSTWIIRREEREYLLADLVFVQSSFARQTFLDQGIAPERLRIVPLGTDVRAFRAPPAATEERCRRILAGEPLRALYVGLLSFRKGLWDLAQVVETLDPQQFRFQLTGTTLPEAAGTLGRLGDRVTLTGRRAHTELPAVYAEADLFVFPTIEDGYANVLPEAAAAGLPILATTNCAAPDMVREGRTGWVVPIRSPEALVDRLRWCAAHRPELAEMVRHTSAEFQPRDWADLARDFETECLEALGEAPAHSSSGVMA